MWMNPPSVYEVTSPTAHSTSRITKIVQSIFHHLPALISTVTTDHLDAGASGAVVCRVVNRVKGGM